MMVTARNAIRHGNIAITDLEEYRKQLVPQAVFGHSKSREARSRYRGKTEPAMGAPPFPIPSSFRLLCALALCTFEKEGMHFP